MKKLLWILVLGLLWCNVSVAADTDWVKTDHNIAYYMLDGWTIIFVNAYKGFNDDEIVYTLQKNSDIISCDRNGRNYETCYKPKGQQD